MYRAADEGGGGGFLCEKVSWRVMEVEGGACLRGGRLMLVPCVGYTNPADETELDIVLLRVPRTHFAADCFGFRTRDVQCLVGDLYRVLQQGQGINKRKREGWRCGCLLC
jgi:hypothetical protein